MRSCRWLGLCALALGLGILICAVFPTGVLLFLGISAHCLRLRLYGKIGRRRP